MKREWIKRAKRALVLLLAVVLIGQVVDWRTVALRASVCPNHTEHDESCGYVEASDGHPCNHEHDDSCYKEVTECTHDHDSSCYEKELDCEEDHDHEDSCYKEKLVCDHTCSEESGCIKKELDCHHEHDASCGYEAPTEGHPCNHSCEQCSGNTSEEDGQNGESKNPEDGQTEVTNPENPEELQPEDSEKKCTCTTLCTSDAINTECPVCGAENAVIDECCEGGQEETGKEDPEEKCTCTALCTSDAINTECPVCGAENAVLEECCKGGQEKEETPEMTEELRAIQDRIDALPTVEEYRELMERYLELSDEAESTEGEASSEGGDPEQGSEELQQISDELEEIEDELDRIAEEVADLLELLFDDDLNLREEYKDLDPAKLLDLYHELFGGIEEYVVVEKHEHDGVEFKPWDDPMRLPTSGDYYLTTDVVLTGTLRSQTLSICLNGHSITASEEPEVFDIIYPSRYPTDKLNIYDCQDNRGSISRDGFGRGITIGKGATVNLYGGTIKGGRVSTGGGVFNQGTLNLYGGVIKDNQATMCGGGIYNDYAGTVNLYGDEDVLITDNTASQSGGGIYNNYGIVRLKNAGIIGNTAGGKSGNIALKGRRIELDSSCSKNLRAGITLLDDSGNSTTGTFTNGDGNLGESNVQNYFFSDDEKYGVQYDVDTKGIALREVSDKPTHIHEWYLNIKNDYLDEKKCDVCVVCGVDGCTYGGTNNSKDMAMAYCEVKVRDCEYTGQPYAGMEIMDTLSDFLEVPVSITTKYYVGNGDEELGYAPVEPGQYRVETTFWLSKQIMAQGANNKYTEKQYFDIMPKPITIGAVYQQKKEEELGENTESVDSDSDKVVVSGLERGYSVKDITLTYDKEEKTITPSGGMIVDSEGNDVTANYKVNYTKGTLKLVQSLDYSVSLEGWSYGDTAKTPVVTEKSASGETKTVDSSRVTYTYYKILNTPTASGDYYEKTTKSNSGASSDGGVPVYAGSYGIKAEVGETDTESEQKNAGEAVAYFQIGKRPLRITANDQYVEAGGEIKAGTEYVKVERPGGGEAYAPGDKIAGIVLKGTSTSVATEFGTITPSQATIENRDNTVRTRNYIITYVSGDLTVTRKDLDLTVTIDGWTYGESPNQPTVTGNDSGGTETYKYYRINGSSVSLTSPETDGAKESGGVPEYAGNYRLIVDVAQTEAYSSKSAQGDFRIAQRELIVTALPQTVKAGGSISMAADKVFANNLAAEDTVSSVTLVSTSTTSAGNGTIEPKSVTIVNQSSRDVTSNYKITYNTGTLTIQRNSLNLTLTMADWVYGDTASEPKLSGNAGNGKVTYTYYKAGSFAPMNGKPYEVGRYVVKADVEATESYSAGMVTTSFTIEKRPVMIAAKQQTVKVGDTIEKDPDHISAKGLAGGDTVCGVELSSSSTMNATESGTITPSNVRIQDKNGGDVTENYAPDYKSGTLVVTRKELSSLAVKLEGWTYGDTPNQPTVTGNDSGGTETYTYYRKNGSSESLTNTGTDGAEKSGGIPKYAGEYCLKADVAQTAAYSSKSAQSDFKIAQRELTVTALPQTVKAGSSISMAADKVFADNLAGGDKVARVALMSTSTASATTEGIITPETVTIVNQSGKDVTSNYKIKYNKGKLTVEQDPLNLTLTMADWVYGETASQPKLTGNAGNGKVTYTYYRSGSSTPLSGKPSEAGSYAVKADVEAAGSHSAGMVVAAFTIGKRPVMITAKRQTVEAGGTIKTGADNVSTDGLVSGHIVSGVELSSSSTMNATESGTITPSNVRIQDENGGDVTENYAPDYKSGTLVVTRRELSSLTVKLEGWTYGDTPNQPTVTGNDSGGTEIYTYYRKNNSSVSLTSPETDGAEESGGVPEYAGEYRLKADIGQTEAYSSKSAQSDFSVAQRELTVTALPQTVKAGSSISMTVDKVFADNLASGDKVAKVTLVSTSTTSVTTEGTITPETVTIVNQSGKDVTANYKITYNTGALTIQHNPLNLTLTMADWVYGNTAAEPKLTGNTGNGKVTYTYYKSDSSTPMNEKPSEAGSYVVKADVEGTGSHSAGMVATSFRIDKRSVTITASPQIVKVGETVKKAPAYISAKGLASGDTVSGVELSSSSTMNATESGTITPSNVRIQNKNGSDVTKNYAPDYESGTMVVTRKDLNLTVTIGGWTYGDSPKTPSVNGDVDGCVPSYTYYKEISVKTNRDNSGADKTGGVPKDAGTWMIEADIALNSKHNAMTGGTKFTINRKEITILAKDQTVKKGGKLPSGVDNAVVSGLASGDKLTAITLSGSTSSVTNRGTIKVSDAKIVDQYGRDVTSCYQITYKNGILTVRDSSSGGSSGGSSSGGGSSGGSSSGGSSSGSTATAGSTAEAPQQAVQPEQPQAEPETEPEQPQQPVETPVQQSEEPELMPQPEPEVIPPEITESKPSGNVKVTVETSGNVKQATDGESVVGVINATLLTDQEEVLKATLEDEEMQAVRDGTDAEVRLVVTRLDDAGDNVPEDARSQIEKMVGILGEYYKGLKLGGYIDIVVEKRLGNGEWMNVATTYGDLEIMIEIPEELFHTDSDYVIMRYHDGSCDLLNDIDDDDRTITIRSDKFSTYAILYAQREGQKSVLPNLIKILFCAAAVAVFLFFIILLRRRREEGK